MTLFSYSLQALSYAQLANLPPINGLYTAVLPAAFYTFFGSSMQLCVGPVALVSLLTAQLINQYGINYTANPAEAVDFAQEAAIAVGLILVCMSLLNLGHLIRFISHPVMSAFTTAAACLIGVNQLKSAFGFTVTVPQQGQTGYEYNYEVFKWFIDNWDGKYSYTAAQIAKSKTFKMSDGMLYRNPMAMRISLGLFFPLMFITLFRAWVKVTPERKRNFWFHVWNIGSALMPLAAIIIGAHVAWQIKHDDGYNNPNITHDWYSYKLSIIGVVTPGLNFIRAPSMKWNFGKLLGDVFPTALIAFMESYSVAHRLATARNELHILNASQELWAVGISNFLAGVSSSYPVAGSFSRSSLNATAGARTPLSKAINMIVVIFSLQFLTRTFQYIPNAALAAVIWVAIYNLISITDFWNAWKYSKKDFFVMLCTATCVFVFDTGIGLAVGLGMSALVNLVDQAISTENAPILVKKYDVHEKAEMHHVLVQQDLTFMSIGRILDVIESLTVTKPIDHTAADLSANERLFLQISGFFDQWLKPRLYTGIDELPKIVIVDLHYTRVADLTSMRTFTETAESLRKKGVRIALINTTPSIAKAFAKIGFENDTIEDLFTETIQQEYQEKYSPLLPVLPIPAVVSVDDVKGEKEYKEVSSSDHDSSDGIEAGTIASTASPQNIELTTVNTDNTTKL